MAPGNQSIDWSNLENIDVSTLSPEQKVEYQKRMIARKNDNIQASIQAYMQGDKDKLKELQTKLNDGFDYSKQLFSQYGTALDNVNTQSWVVYNRTKDYNLAKSDYNTWNGASSAIQSYEINGSGDVSNFSGGLWGDELPNQVTDVDIAKQKRFLSDNLEKYSKKKDNAEQELITETDNLSVGKKVKFDVDSQLSQQIWRNRMAVNEMKVIEEQLRMYYIYQNYNGGIDA